MEEPRERVGALGAGEVRVEQLDRDIAIELGVAREVDDAGRAAAELADQPVARAGLDARDIAGRDRLAGDRSGATGQRAQPLDAHADVRIVDVAAEHGLVVAQRALVIAALARVLGEQVVGAQRVGLLAGQPSRWRIAVSSSPRCS